MDFDQTFMIATITQALLYGLYIATLVHCLRWLLFSDEENWSLRKDVNWRMLIIAVVIFLLSTASLVTALQDVFTLLDSINTINVSASNLPEE